jgi:predicted nucleotidyltransferase
MFDRLQGVFESLNSHQVKYLVIGGVAAIAHGAERATFDLDILIEPTLENARRLLQALLAANFGTAALITPEQLLRNEVVKFRDWVVIDVQTSTPGLEWAKAWERRVTGVAHGVTVVSVSLEDLLASKRAAGRKKDLADIEFLTADDHESDESGE